MSEQQTDPVLCVGLALGRSGSQNAEYAIADTAGIQRLDEAEWAVWNLATGVWSPTGRWGRSDLARAAHEAHLVGFDAAYDRLLERGLLLQADQGGQWATRVRAHPLLSGIGELAAGGSELGLGVLGRSPIVRLDRATFDCWQWLPMGESVATAAQALGLVSAEHGWSTLTDRVARLIAHGALYLHTASLPAAKGAE